MSLFKYFTDERHARAFIRKGVMRFGSLASYRRIEDGGVSLLVMVRLPMELVTPDIASLSWPLRSPADFAELPAARHMHATS